MKIYVSHSKDFDYKNELYLPLKNSILNREHKFIFPHDNNNETFDSKSLIENKKCDLILAEVSHVSTGLGIELGWADAYKIPIICIYRTGASISNSLKVVCNKFIEYNNKEEMIKNIININL